MKNERVWTIYISSRRCSKKDTDRTIDFAAEVNDAVDDRLWQVAMRKATYLLAVSLLCPLLT